MTVLTRKQIAAAATAGGFTGNDVNIAVAVALAESGGDTNSHNATPPDNSYGLWQINMLGSMGPERRKRFGLKKNEELFDPVVNAKAAYGVWKSQGWAKGWTTYSSGKYKKFLSDDAVPGDASPGGASQSSAASTSGITGAFNAFGSTIFKGLANIAGIFVAIALVVMGIILLNRESVKKVVPLGKIGKLVK